MDTSKAMAILGFSPSQTFESTTIQEVNRAFMYKMHILQMNNSNKVLFHKKELSLIEMIFDNGDNNQIFFKESLFFLYFDRPELNLTKR